MKQQEFIRSLSAEQRKALTKKSDQMGLRSLAVHWGLIGCLAILIAVKVPLWPLLMLPQGILIVFCFTLLHETSHRTPFATASLNDSVGQICGYMIALPAQWFRCFHFEHHRHTQDSEHDPELAEPKPSTPWQYAKHVSGLPVWLSHSRTLLRNARGRCDDSYVPDAKMPKVRSEARTMLMVYVAVAVVALVFQLSVVLYVWVIPALLGQPFLRLYLLAEHGRCAFGSNIFDNTRTTISNRLVRKLAWCMPYHTEHHAFPSVPFHRLHELHTLMKPQLKQLGCGYVSFNKDYLQAISRQ